MMKFRLSLILKLLLVVVVVAAAGAWGYAEAVKRAWLRYNEWDIRAEGTLRVGDAAPDIELASADGGAPVKLSQLYGERPLVLVFGSYT